MAGTPQRGRGHGQARSGGRVPATAVLLAVLGVTGAAALLVGEHEDREAQADLDYRAREAASRVADRLLATEQVLRSASAYLAANGLHDQQGFGAYVAALRLELYHPGLAGLAYCRLEPGAGFSRVPWEGFPCGDLRQEGPLAPPSAAGWRELVLQGAGTAPEPLWREAMDLARDEARMALSGRMAIAADLAGTQEPGVFISFPLYTPGPAPTSTAERRLRLAGWAYAPLHLDALEAVAAERAGDDLLVALQVGPRASAHSRLLFEPEPPPATGRFQARAPVGVGDRRWAVTIRSRPTFDARVAASSLQVPVAVGGTLLATSLASVVLALGRSRGRAAGEAARLDAELRAVDQELALREAALARVAEELEGCNETADRLLGLARAAGAAAGAGPGPEAGPAPASTPV